MGNIDVGNREERGTAQSDVSLLRTVDNDPSLSPGLHLTGLLIMAPASLSVIVRTVASGSQPHY